MSYIYDTLLLVDATGDLVPWLASRYQRSPDGLTYTFELREDARWHDGRPLTADDVVFTFDYFADQTLPPFVIARPQDIASVKKTDERTVTFGLNKPAVTFAEAVGSRVPIVPKHIWSSIDAGGPQVTGAAPAALAPFRDDPAFGVLEGPLDLTVALYWNQEKGGALTDLRFRRACALAIDRSDIVKRLLGGQGEAGNPGFLPPDHPFDVDVEQYPFDREAANRMLDDAGYRRTGGDGPRRDRGGRALHAHPVFRKAAFDQWSYTPNAGFYGSPINKRVLVTGLDQGVEIRPTK